MARTKATAKRNPQAAAAARTPIVAAKKASKGAKTKAVVPADGEQKAKKAHRYRPGTVALREIRRYQKTVDCQIPKKTLIALIRQITQEFGDFRYRVEALEAIREAAEQFLTNLFTDALLAAIHARRITIMDRDMRFIVALLASHGHTLFMPTLSWKRTHYSERDPHPFPAKKERLEKLQIDMPPAAVAAAVVADAAASTEDGDDAEKAPKSTPAPPQHESLD